MMNGDFVKVNLIVPPKLSYRVDTTVIDDFKVDVYIIIVGDETGEFDPNRQHDGK